MVPHYLHRHCLLSLQVQNDYLQQRLEDRGDTPPPSDASQLTTARLSGGSASDSRLARADGTGRGQGTGQWGSGEDGGGSGKGRAESSGVGGE